MCKNSASVSFVLADYKMKNRIVELQQFEGENLWK